MTLVNSYTINNLVYYKQPRIIEGNFHSIVYEIVYSIRVSATTLRILYYGPLYEVVYCIRNEVIPVTAYTSNRLYE